MASSVAVATLIAAGLVYFSFPGERLLRPRVTIPLSNLTLEDKTSCPPAMGPGFLGNNNPLSWGCEVYNLVMLRVERKERQGERRKKEIYFCPQPNTFGSRNKILSFLKQCTDPHHRSWKTRSCVSGWAIVYMTIYITEPLQKYEKDTSRTSKIWKIYHYLPYINICTFIFGGERRLYHGLSCR